MNVSKILSLVVFYGKSANNEYSMPNPVCIYTYIVVVMPQTILPRRNRRCALSATGTQKPEEEKDTRSVTYFMEENVISPREVARFNEHIRN